MSINYERDKWYKASENPTPQVQGSIYFITNDGKKHAGTYIDYSQFMSLDEEIFHQREVDKWMIRDPQYEEPKKDSITYKGKKIYLNARNDIGFYWRASYKENGSDIYVNMETKKEAINSLKQIIDNR